MGLKSYLQSVDLRVAYIRVRKQYLENVTLDTLPIP